MERSHLMLKHVKNTLCMAIQYVLVQLRKIHAAELCSEIANGKVLNLELYTQRRQRLTLLHLFTDLFHTELFLTLQNRYQVEQKR